MKRFKFTVKRIERLKPETKDVEYTDLETAGLKLRLYANGSKVWRWKGVDKLTGKRRNIRLGAYPAITLDQARQMSEDLNFKKETGATIKTVVEIQKEKETFGQLFSRHLENYCKPRKRSWKDDLGIYNRYIKDVFEDVPAEDITPEDIDNWRNKLLRTVGERTGRLLTPGTVDRATTVFSGAYSKSAKRIENPVAGVEKFQQTKRERFIKVDDMPSFREAVDSNETPEYIRDLVLIALLTGARRGNIFSMMWNEIDFSSKTWTIPASKMKNKKKLVVHLVDDAVEILEKRRAVNGSLYVFPSLKKTAKSPHVDNITKGWNRLCERANQKGLRFHDLRRTAASNMLYANVNPLIITKVLGQSAQMVETYQRMQDDATKNAIQAGGNVLSEISKGTKKVVNIK